MSPLAQDRVVVWLVLLFAASQLFAVGWDLPGSYGWENDGIAPRDFFAGIAINLTPSQGHRYPLFHNLLIGVLSIPVLLPAALSAKEWTLPALMEQVLTVPVMTSISIIAKVVSLLMACVSLLLLARIARRTANRQASRWAVVWAATCLTFAYYGRVSNLDGPYLMWTTLAIDRLIDITQEQRVRDYVLFGVLAGAAVATKDQAYASFVLPALISMGALPLRSNRPLGPRKAHFTRCLYTIVAGVTSLGVLGGGAFNPLGFAARVRELTGSASHDWMNYTRTPQGVLANWIDILAAQERFFWPWAVVVLCWSGVGLALWHTGTKHLRLLPLSVGIGSVLFFTLIVARCEHRFVLPLGFWLAYYGGIASEACSTWWAVRYPSTRYVPTAALALLALWAAGHSIEVHLTQRGDARHQVHRYLKKLPRGTVVETYGLLVHLPHLDRPERSPYRVQRVSRRPVEQRNPLAGALEIDEPYGNVGERRPDVLVIPEFTALGHLPRQLDAHRVHTAGHKRAHADQDAQRFFHAALNDTLPGYSVVLMAEPTLPRWASWLGAKPVRVHASVGNRQWVLQRNPPVGIAETHVQHGGV